MTLLDLHGLQSLRRAHLRYREAVPAAYDEVLDEVNGRVRSRGSLGKADIGAVLLWKRLRADTPWATSLSSMTDAAVRQITRDAVAAVRDVAVTTVEAASNGRRALAPLPGLQHGDALASALLVAAAPERLAVYDRRAHKALHLLGLPLANSRGRYGRYMALVDELRHALGAVDGHAWTAREVDAALYWLGR